MRHPWVDLDLFMFPPFPLVSRLVGHVCESLSFRDVSGRTLLAKEGMVRRHSSADTTTSHPALVVRPASAVSLLLFCQGVNALILPTGKISSGPSESLNIS